MHVTLINPPALIGRFNYSAFTHPPIGTAYLAACLRQHGHEVAVIDAVGEAISRFAPYPGSKRFLVQGLADDDIIRRVPGKTAMIGLSCMFSHAWPPVRSLIRKLKQHFPRTPIIAGGEHPTAMYGLCLDQAPLAACVLGEGEDTIIEIADNLACGRSISEINGMAWKEPHTGRIHKNPDREKTVDLDALPFPAWDLIPWKAYKLYEGPVLAQAIPMLASRGCPHDCAFCAAPSMWNRAWRNRSVKNIADEMKTYFVNDHIKEFQFLDINPLVSRKWIRELCSTIRDRFPGIRWQMPVGGRPEILDADTARLLIESGCRHIQFAPESGSPDVLAAMNKRLDLKAFRRAVLTVQKAGMSVSILFIIGYPGETGRDIRLTYRLIRWLARQGIDEIAVSTFVLLPGTRIFADMQTTRSLAIDDAFLFQTAGATSLIPAVSWNEKIKSNKLFLLKWWGLAQFYILAFGYHPRRLYCILQNLVKGRQQTKTDRVLAEIVEKIKLRAF